MLLITPTYQIYHYNEIYILEIKARQGEIAKLPIWVKGGSLIIPDTILMASGYNREKVMEDIKKQYLWYLNAIKETFKDRNFMVVQITRHDLNVKVIDGFYFEGIAIVGLGGYYLDNPDYDAPFFRKIIL